MASANDPMSLNLPNNNNNTGNIQMSDLNARARSGNIPLGPLNDPASGAAGGAAASSQQ